MLYPDKQLCILEEAVAVYKIDSKAFKHIMNNFEAVMESFYDGLYITDGSANTLYVNHSYERITGLCREDLIGKNMKEIETKGFLSKSATLMVIEKKEMTTIMQQFRTGKKALVTSTPIFNKEGDIILVVTNVRDVTELNNLKAELEENRVLAEKYFSEIEEMRLKLIKSSELIAEDETTVEVLRKSSRVARVDTTVLIYGETGTGKEEIAKFIHNNSKRSDKQFITINCGAIPENLIESELFGYEKGAFTGASEKGKMGLFEVADGGTLFLDEIGELPLSTQVKLLRVLQEGTIQRVGGVKQIKVNVRVVAATNKDLEEMVKKKLFRDDLFYRLNVVPIYVPPLRERRHDIVALIKHYLDTFNKKYGFSKTFDAKAIDALCEYEWPGNIRQLRNVVERVLVMSNQEEIQLSDLPQKILDDLEERNVLGNIRDMPLKEALVQLESKMIRTAYEKYGNVRDAAKSLGIDPSTFVRKRQRYEKHVALNQQR